MSRQSKIKRNEPCPCLSAEKFKNCCSGKVNWETIKEQNSDYRPYLSVRGRNLLFASRVAEVLQLDGNIEATRLKDYKAAFTVDAVRKIHEALLDLWPPEIDINQALKQMPLGVSGLYIGDYSPEYITRAIVRHSIYANRILLIDPFVYPASMRDEFNPIINPAQYRAQTLRNVNLWFALLPWIDSGLVALIRPPSDFDHQLNWDLMKAQEKKFKDSAELKAATKESVEELRSRHTKGLLRQQLLLGAPDSYLKRKFEELGLGANGLKVDEFLKAIHKEREKDPNFLEPLGPKSEAQLVMMSSGTSYPSASITAGITGSYLFTDLHAKWKEIELDRESHSAENKVWAPFAKALQDTQLRYLNNLSLDHALGVGRGVARCGGDDCYAPECGERAG
jgi:SEC-C motif-containing protein